MSESAHPVPLRPALIIGCAVFVLTGLIWQLGLFQVPELWIYDAFVHARSNPEAKDPRIMIVAIGDTDIQRLNYPLQDTVLSALLQKIESGGPAVIGLDLYRDLPEPREGTSISQLDQVLHENPNIICIFRFGTRETPFAIPPPPAVVADSSRYAFNNFCENATVRRALLLMWINADSAYQSLALLMTQIYLSGHNVPVTQEGDNIRLGKTTFMPFRGSNGGYLREPDTGYQFMQDFRGPSQFDSISVEDALALKDTSRFKDKIVLIGIEAFSSNDTFATPLAERVPGVVVHGQIINQLLRAAIDGDRPTVGVDRAWEWLYLAAWCAVGSGIGFLVRTHFFFALATVACVAGVVLAGWLLFLHSYWIIVFAPAGACLTAATAAKAYAVNFEEAQREKLMTLFSQSVSSAVAQELWSKRDLFLKGGRPVPQRLTATVLFTDLRNFSTISEGMTPDDLVAWINECLSALAQHVRANGGIVNNYMGDGMMAIFGVPVPSVQEEEIARDATNAVQCAVAMGREIRQLNAQLKEKGRPFTGLRVGVHTGTAMAGSIGSSDLHKYTVIGDTVNIASRLESVDKEEALTGPSGDCRILISNRTNDLLNGRFRTQAVGNLKLKGKAETVDVYKVLD